MIEILQLTQFGGYLEQLQMRLQDTILVIVREYVLQIRKKCFIVEDHVKGD